MRHMVHTLIHIHTNYSFDGNISPEVLACEAKQAGIDCIAVTDHDTIEGAQHLASLDLVRVIVGEEVSTRDGDLIGLFLSRRIEPGLSVRETALAIKGQGGLVLVPHPFIRVLGRGIGSKIWDIVDLIDAVETLNAQNILRRPDREAERFARSMDFTSYVGSDAHMVGSVAPCHQLMPDFNDPAQFLDSLGQAQLIGRRHPWWYFVAAGYHTVLHLSGRPLPKGYGSNYRPLPTQTPAALPTPTPNNGGGKLCPAHG